MFCLTCAVLAMVAVSCGRSQPVPPTVVALDKDQVEVCKAVLKEIATKEAEGKNVAVISEVGDVHIAQDEFGEFLIRELQRDLAVDKDFSRAVYALGSQRSSLNSNDLQLPTEIRIVPTRSQGQDDLNVTLSVPVMNSSKTTSLVIANMRSIARDGREYVYVATKDGGEWTVKGKALVKFE